MLVTWKKMALCQVWSPWVQKTSIRTSRSPLKTSGQVIKEFPLDGGQKGNVEIVWDGKDKNGNPAKEGKYPQGKRYRGREVGECPDLCLWQGRQRDPGYGKQSDSAQFERPRYNKLEQYLADCRYGENTINPHANSIDLRSWICHLIMP